MSRTTRRLIDQIRKPVPKPTKVIKSKKQKLRDKEDFKEIIQHKEEELCQMK